MAEYLNSLRTQEHGASKLCLGEPQAFLDQLRASAKWFPSDEALHVRTRLDDLVEALAGDRPATDLIFLTVADGHVVMPAPCLDGDARFTAATEPQRPVQFEITEQTRDAVAGWISTAHLKSEQFLFPSRLSESPHLSTRQYSRIVGSWVESIGLDPAAYGTHSLRRTKPTLIYRRTRNLRAVQLLLGHSKLESTVRYLGIEVDDALEIAEQTEV
jgi:hypothetical protein